MEIRIICKIIRTQFSQLIKFSCSNSFIEFNSGISILFNRHKYPRFFMIDWYPSIYNALAIGWHIVIHDAIRGLHTLAAQSKSVVTIYALDHVLAYLGAPLINDFHEAYPSIILSIVDTTDAMALAALTAQQCNFAIVTGPLDETRFEGIPLFFSNYSVRMHKSHPLAKKPFLTYDDLDGQTIISKGRAYDCFRHHIDQHILVPGRQIHILAETADESIIRALLLGNKAINIGYDYADALYPHPDIVSRRLKAENGGQMIYLVANLQVRTTKASRLFREFLLEWIHKKDPTS